MALLVTSMQLLNMEPVEGEGKQHLNFAAPSRGLIGFRSQVGMLLCSTSCCPHSLPALTDVRIWRRRKLLRQSPSLLT